MANDSDDDIMKIGCVKEKEEVKTSDAIHAMRVLREYFQDDPVALGQFYKLDDAFSKKRCDKMKQSHISDFFHNYNNDSLCDGEGFSGNFA